MRNYYPSYLAHAFCLGFILTVNAFSGDGDNYHHAPTGGGTTRAGLKGEYFSNPDFKGAPAFIRRDVRITFDWKKGVAGHGLPVGGATTPGMKDFPHGDFSIRWAGQIVPRFSETYTFRITGKDGVRFKIGEKTLVDSLGASAVKEVAFGPMKAGEKYDIVFEYVNRADTEGSEARLEWSSQSTPWEVVDPISFAQICGHQAGDSAHFQCRERADVKRESIQWFDERESKGKGFNFSKILTGTDVDVNGWPQVDDVLVKVPAEYQGKYRVRFRGQANVEVSSQSKSATWASTADGSGETYTADNSKGPFGGALLPKGVGYNPKENITTAWVTFGSKPEDIHFVFTGSEREPGKPGITELEVFTPVAQGASETHQSGELLKREARKTFENFVIVRLHGGMSQSPGHTWEDRTLPAYNGRSNLKGWGYCLEEYIMIANESGMDWHLCFGASWDQDYMKKFAQMIRYGSDGVNPYDHYVENPKYPPLNPNLRIYLEHSNELPWAVYPKFIWDDLRKKAAENAPDWQIVNYDGKARPNDFRTMLRYHALRMKQMSDAFRSVYADVPGAMGERVRVLCFGQYHMNLMNTMLQFLDTYFNNGDGQAHVADPHPPSYFLWGGGGAIYYGCKNKFGFMEKEVISNGGFEEVKVPEGTAALRPTNTGWTFTGNAGVCNVKLPGVEAVTVKKMAQEPPKPLDKDTWVGLKFTVGDKDLFVYKLGRWMSNDPKYNFYTSPMFDMVIFDEAGDRAAGFEGGSKLSNYPNDHFGYDWCGVQAFGKKKVLPAYLQAGKTYYLVSHENAASRGERFSGPCEVSAAPGLTIRAAVTSKDLKRWNETPGSLAYGPVNMVFATEGLRTSEGGVGVPPDTSEAKFFGWSPNPGKPEINLGVQCAFLQGDNSSMSREFTVDKAGAYWITFNPCMDRLSNGHTKQRWGWVTGGFGTIRVKVDGEDVTPSLLPGNGYMASSHVFQYASTQVFKLQPGKHTVTFERVNSRNGTAFIDEVHLSSEEAFYGGPDAPNFPDGGNAFGQNSLTGYHLTAQAECEMARNWGLVPCTYEGGWAVQGDFDSYSMLAWNDLRFGSKAANPELTKQALRNSFNLWCKMGGYIYAYFYPVQKNTAQTDAPLLQCVQELNDRLPVSSDAGITLPCTLTVEMPHTENTPDGLYTPSWEANKSNPEAPAYGSKSWIVTSKETADYTITLVAGGGEAELRVDDATVLARGDTGSKLTGKMHLTAGVHSIKVKALGHAIKVEKINVQNDGRKQQP